MESDSNGILQRKRAGDVGRRHFTRAMTEHGGGLDAPRSPQRRQRDLQRKDRRLPEAGLLDLRALLVGRQLVQQRPAGEPAEQIAHLLDGAAKDGLLRQQLAPHRPPLLAHARADEYRVRRRARDAAGRVVGAAPLLRETPRAAPPTRHCRAPTRARRNSWWDRFTPAEKQMSRSASRRRPRSSRIARR